MADVYLGQIMMGGFNFAPRGFAACNGQLLPIAQNQALFALLGTAYGGNGSNTFALPNLQGCTPVGAGASVDGAWQPSPYQTGTRAGQELSPASDPIRRTRMRQCVTTPHLENPTNTLFAAAARNPSTVRRTASDPVHQTLRCPAATSASNMQPFSVINFNIA